MACMSARLTSPQDCTLRVLERRAQLQTSGMSRVHTSHIKCLRLQEHRQACGVHGQTQEQYEYNGTLGKVTPACAIAWHNAPFPTTIISRAQVVLHSIAAARRERFVV